MMIPVNIVAIKAPTAIAAMLIGKATLRKTIYGFLLTLMEFLENANATIPKTNPGIQRIPVEEKTTAIIEMIKEARALPIGSYTLLTLFSIAYIF